MINLSKIISRVLHKTKALILYGDRFYCPICGGRYRKFLPGGVKLRPNAKCPGCGSLERDRLLWIVLEYLWKTHKISKGGHLLHVAPESMLAKKFKQNYDYLSVDLDGSRAMQAMDITDINLPDCQFDAIVCNHVLEHIPDDTKAMSELYRVLKPGGWASLQIPRGTQEDTEEDLSITDPEERERLYGNKEHVRRYGKDYQLRLEKAGFEVLTFSKEDVLTPDIKEKVSVESEKEIWISRKRLKSSS